MQLDPVGGDRGLAMDRVPEADAGDVQRSLKVRPRAGHRSTIVDEPTSSAGDLLSLERRGHAPALRELDDHRPVATLRRGDDQVDVAVALDSRSSWSRVKRPRVELEVGVARRRWPEVAWWRSPSEPPDRRPVRREVHLRSTVIRQRLDRPTPVATCRCSHRRSGCRPYRSKRWEQQEGRGQGRGHGRPSVDHGADCTQDALVEFVTRALFDPRRRESGLSRHTGPQEPRIATDEGTGRGSFPRRVAGHASASTGRELEAQESAPVCASTRTTGSGRFPSCGRSRGRTRSKSN
jgi:hypothetical protein